MIAKHSWLLLCLVAAAASAQTVTRKSIRIEDGDTYLSFPVDREKERVPARIALDGQSLDEFVIRLADEEPQFWT